MNTATLNTTDDPCTTLESLYAAYTDPARDWEVPGDDAPMYVLLDDEAFLRDISDYLDFMHDAEVADPELTVHERLLTIRYYEHEWDDDALEALRSKYSDEIAAYVTKNRLN